MSAAAEVQSCSAFAGHRLIASGAPREVVGAVKAAVEAGESVLVFDDVDARPVEFDLRGDLVWVVAGDASVIKSHLDTLGPPVEVRQVGNRVRRAVNENGGAAVKAALPPGFANGRFASVVKRRRPRMRR